MTRANNFTLSTTASKRLLLSKMRELLDEQAVHALHQESKSSNSKRSPLLICAWCQRVEISTGNWKELDNLAQRELLTGSNAPLLTHGICPQCFKTTMNETQGPVKSEYPGLLNPR